MNKFYTTKLEYKLANKEEFYNFIKNYPRKLTCDCYSVCEPPSITYNDFELANRWPYSIVASTFAYSDNSDDYYYCPEEEKVYQICLNYQEAFNSKTGYKEKN